MSGPNAGEGAPSDPRGRRSLSADDLAAVMAERHAEAARMDRASLRALVEELLDDAARLEIVAPADVERLVDLRFSLEPGERQFAAAAVLASTDVPAKARLDMIDKHVRPQRPPR